MGYSHYWAFGPYIEEKAYKAALKDCRKIIRNSPVPLGNWNGFRGPNLRNGFNFNGLHEDQCENFAMGADPDRDTWFCKTNGRPYDVVVVACLCALADRLGNTIEVSSDGDPHEWEAGKALATKVLGRTIEIPGKILRMENKRAHYREQYLAEHPEYCGD